MNQEEIIRNAEKVIEKSERIEALTRSEGWKDYIELLDVLLNQEITALAGQKLDGDYYKKIGFLQYTAFIKAIPTIIKDKSVREYLLHQGFAKAIEVARGVPFIYNKKKSMAQQQLQQILGNAGNAEELKKTFTQDVYNQG